MRSINASLSVTEILGRRKSSGIGHAGAQTGIYVKSDERGEDEDEGEE